jgi:hypothetical protein
MGITVEVESYFRSPCLSWQNFFVTSKNYRRATKEPHRPNPSHHNHSCDGKHQHHTTQVKWHLCARSNFYPEALVRRTTYFDILYFQHNDELECLSCPLRDISGDINGCTGDRCSYEGVRSLTRRSTNARSIA